MHNPTVGFIAAYAAGLVMGLGIGLSDKRLQWMAVILAFLAAIAIKYA